jgi:hypothetical protein
MGWFGWMHGVPIVTAACDWLAATSSYCIKGMHGRLAKGKNERSNRRKERTAGL